VSEKVRAVSAWEGPLLGAATLDSLRKLDPRVIVRNPVMLVVEIGSVLTTLIWIRDIVRPSPGAMPAWFSANVALWLWFTVVFANFAEALAEGRGKAQAAALRGLRQETIARKLVDGREERVAASTLRKGDVVVVEAGQVIPGDGEVTSGIASVDESAVTGESAPVIRESGGDRSAVTGGTRVLSDRVVVRIGVDPVHFGIVLIVGVGIGLFTPPVGMGLYAMQGFTKTSFGEVVAAVFPWLLPLVGALLVITYVPWIALALPRALGY